MSKQRGRDLNLLDAMILVAATAVGLSLISAGGWYQLKNLGGRANIRGWLRYLVLYMVAARSLLPILSCWTFAVLAIRLRRPRPSCRRLARQPGMIACLVPSAITTLLVALFLIGDSWLMPPDRNFIQNAVQASENYAPQAVLGAWVALLPGRRFRIEPGPIDRMGICLGVGWISICVPYLANLFHPFL